LAVRAFQMSNCIHVSLMWVTPLILVTHAPAHDWAA
jgi:hypothetical protein